MIYSHINKCLKKTRLKDQYKIIIINFYIDDNLDMIYKYLFLKTKMLFYHFFFLTKILSKQKTFIYILYINVFYDRYLSKIHQNCFQEYVFLN